MAMLSMILDNKIIETRLFPNAHLKIEGYVQGLKNDMLEQNDDLLKESKGTPEFKVEVVPRKITRH